MSNIQTSLKALSLTVLIYHLYQLSSRWQQLPKKSHKAANIYCSLYRYLPQSFGYLSATSAIIQAN